MVRTRVGYCGGSSDDPTYQRLGGHAEAIQIDFDPSRLAFRALLEELWTSPSARGAGRGSQYRSAIFTASDEQRHVAAEARVEHGARLGRRIETPLEPLRRFFLAEDYHQKYSLRHDSLLWHELSQVYDAQAVVDSTVAARLNAACAGDADRAVIVSELERYELSPKAQARLLTLALPEPSSRP